MIKLAPSVLAADFSRLGEEIKKVHENGAEYLHLDVMDGMFVPNMSFGFDTVRAINTVSDLPLDVHMMTCVPQNYLDALKDAGADIVTIHNDIGLSEDELMDVLKNIHARGMKAAMSLKPKFPAETVFPFMEELDMVLIMTVEPGFGGQKFMPDMLEKIAAVRHKAMEMGKDMDIQVDGGINAANAALAAAYGANVFVVGTASFRAPDMKVALDDVKKAAEEAYGKNL